MEEKLLQVEWLDEEASKKAYEELREKMRKHIDHHIKEKENRNGE